MRTYAFLQEWLGHFSAGKQFLSVLNFTMPINQHIGFLGKKNNSPEGVEIKFVVFDQKNLIRGEVSLYNGESLKNSQANLSVFSLSSLRKKGFYLTKPETYWGTDFTFTEQILSLEFENGETVTISPSEFDQAEDEYSSVIQKLLQLEDR